MSIKGFIAAALAWATIMCLSSASAAESVSVGEALRVLAASRAANCPTLQQNVAKARTESSLEVGTGLEAAYRTLCVCVPARLNKLRSSMSPAQLDAQVSEREVQELYMTQVAGKCAAEEWRLSFGEGCAERFAKTRANSKKYCRCMSGLVAKLSDSEIAALGLASAGKNPPAEPAPEMKKILEDERACSAP